MAIITFKGQELHTQGALPSLGSTAPDFIMTKADLSDINLYSFKDKFKLLNIFPSINTGTCALSVRRLNRAAEDLDQVAIINLSMDLPFAQTKFCSSEGIEKVLTASLFRSEFFKKYPIDITEGPLRGLSSRVIIILDDQNKVIYTEQVAELTNEPKYDEALKTFTSSF